MVNRLLQVTAVLAFILTLIVIVLPSGTWGQVPDATDTATEQVNPSEPVDASEDVDPSSEPDKDNDFDEDVDNEQGDQELPTGTVAGEQGDGGQSGEVVDTGLLEQSAQTSNAASVAIYCDIPDVNFPNQRVVGTDINFLTGFGDPEVHFVVLDIAGNVVDATGASPRPSSNPAIAPVNASIPNPVNWEWGPGNFSKLTVTAIYPSLDPTSYPDSSSSIFLTCIPDPPTPTPFVPPTVDPSITPPPPPTAADYRPAIVTEMKDIAGNTIPDGATVAAGSGIYDTAIISGLPPGTIGSVLYAMSGGNCRQAIFALGDAVPVVAGSDGVAIVPPSNIFTVPGFPGGAYDWIVIYMDPIVGNVSSGCGAETFNVDLPLPNSGDGSARLTCFLQNPPVPGRAGYAVNVSPLPPTGTVEVNVTLQLSTLVFEYKSVTLPPGTTQDLEFYGAYVFAWVNVIFRDEVGEIYAVVNLSGACTAAPGPTPTPVPTTVPTEPPPSTVVPTILPTEPPPPTVVPTILPTETVASTDMPTLTPTSTSTETGTLSPTESATGTHLPPTATSTAPHTDTTAADQVKPSMEPEETPLLVGLPNTGSNVDPPIRSAGVASILVAAGLLAALTVWIVRREYAGPR